MSPSGSLPLPVSWNGVRTGIVSGAGTLTVGMALPVAVTVPPRVVRPPLATSPAKPLAPPVTSMTCSKAASCPASAPPKLTVKPVSPRLETVTVPPAGQPAMPSMAALMSAVVKLVPRTMGTESAPW